MNSSLSGDFIFMVKSPLTNVLLASNFTAVLPETVFWNRKGAQEHDTAGYQGLSLRRWRAAHMIRVLIAEDDPQCFLQMEQFIRDYSSETGRAFQITRYDNGEDLVEQYRPEFDLLLLDVDMPFMDGMTAAGHIRKMDPEVVIVFVTNLAQYAIQGYSVNALDYILKPLNYFSFSQRLTRCLRYVKKREGGYITVAVKGGTLKLEIGDIPTFPASSPPSPSGAPA